jgi:hypothetical protein
MVRFQPEIANPLPPKFAAITGDKEVMRSNPLIRRAWPEVSEWTLNDQWAAPQQGECAGLFASRHAVVSLQGVRIPQPCPRPAS